jgi:UDP-glucose 4-epimerase
VRILVTGATGFIASHLIPALADDGHHVIALGHDVSRIPTSATAVLELDLAKPVDLARLPSVDAIVHLAQANVPFPDGAGPLFAVNTASTERLLEHALRCGAACFVYASSASVYGFGERPWRETDEPRARDFYSATKLASEHLLNSYSDRYSTISLRLVTPYGPGQTNRLIPRLIDRVGREPIVLNEGGRPRLNPVFVDDVVNVVRALLVGDTTGALNVAGEKAVTIRELSEAVGRLTGVEPEFAESDATVGGDLVADTSRMREVLAGQSLVSLEDGLARTVAAVLARA